MNGGAHFCVSPGVGSSQAGGGREGQQSTAHTWAVEIRAAGRPQGPALTPLNSLDLRQGGGPLGSGHTRPIEGTFGGGLRADVPHTAQFVTDSDTVLPSIRVALKTFPSC